MKNTIIVKIGGSVLAKSKNRFIDFLKKLVRKNKVIIIHGGGPEINAWLQKFGIKPKFVSGIRFTDKKTMEVVTMILSGKVNKELTVRLNKAKIPAVGISAADGKIAVCRQLKKLGLVGEPIKINNKLLEELLKCGYIPVLSSVGISADGKLLNINADALATALACNMKATKLIFITDVAGVLDDKKRIIKNISEKSARQYFKKGIITGGMIPKIKACLNATKKGVGEVVITDLSGSGTRIS